MRSSNLPVKNRTPDFSLSTRGEWDEFDSLVNPVYENKNNAYGSADISITQNHNSDLTTKPLFSFWTIVADCFRGKRENNENEKTTTSRNSF